MSELFDKSKLRSIQIGTASIVIMLLFVSIVGRMVMPSITGSTKMTTESVIISLLLDWVMLLLVWLYSCKIEKQSLLLWAETDYPILFHLKAVLGIFAVFFAITIPVLIIMQLLHLVKVSPKIAEIKSIVRDHKVLLFMVPVTAGVVEEFIFRGYLLPRMEIIFKNSYAAIIVSSLLFGLLHYSYGTVMNVVGPMLLGFVFTIFYWKYHNITVPIFCHFLWDFISLSISIKGH